MMFLFLILSPQLQPLSWVSSLTLAFEVSGFNCSWFGPFVCWVWIWWESSLIFLNNWICFRSMNLICGTHGMFFFLMIEPRPVCKTRLGYLYLFWRPTFFGRRILSDLVLEQEMSWLFYSSSHYSWNLIVDSFVTVSFVLRTPLKYIYTRTQSAVSFCLQLQEGWFLLYRWIELR